MSVPKKTFLPMLGVLIVLGVMGYVVETQYGVSVAERMLRWVLMPVMGVVVALAGVAQLFPALFKKLGQERVLRLFEDDNAIGIALGTTVLGAAAFSIGARIIWGPY